MLRVILVSLNTKRGTYGSGYKLILTRNSDNAVLNKDNALNIGSIKINCFEWYIPNNTPAIPQQATLSKQILSKTPTEF